MKLQLVVQDILKFAAALDESQHKESEAVQSLQLCQLELHQRTAVLRGEVVESKNKHMQCTQRLQDAEEELEQVCSLLVVLMFARSWLPHRQGQCLYCILLGMTLVQDSWVARMTGSACSTLPGSCCPVYWQHQAPKVQCGFSQENQQCSQCNSTAVL